MRSVQVANVAAAFERIAAEHGPCKELNTDEGTEFVNAPFQAVLRRLNIVHRVKVRREDLSVVDRRIQLLKQSLFKRTAHIQTRDWASVLQAAVRGLNNTGTEPLHGIRTK